MEYRDYPNSSNVDRIAWYPSITTLDGADDSDLDVLTIRFKSGQTWAYWPISPPQWEQLRDVDGSIGSLVQKAIVGPARRAEYQSRKLPGEWLGENNVDAALQEQERKAADATSHVHNIPSLGGSPSLQHWEGPRSVQTQPATPPKRRRVSKLG